MVKCPRGTPAQIQANLINLSKPENLSVETNFWSNDEEKEETSEFSEELEIDSNKAGKRNSATSQDVLVNCFVGHMLDTLLESWSGKPCFRPKLKEPNLFTPSLSDIEGESELLPCEYPSNLSATADYLADLYKKRSSTLEKSYENQKTKSISESNESAEFGQNAEEEFGEPETTNPGEPEPDEEVHFVFVNGAWYKGRVSRRLMDGEGTYFWEDGTIYSGEFVEGCPTGKGRMEFPSQSVYEGGVYKGFRHGEGIHCLHESSVMYTGQWWLGKKHGEGLMVYNEPSKGHNFYRGQWQNGVKEGFGYRQYPSGAKYIGFWSNGKRHGKGVMLWANNDIYRGQWKEGLWHGYGEYTWNGFVNKTLSYPATNTYRGFWSEGKRNGRGVFETINDGIIDTFWEDDLKSGPGTVICSNGTKITAERLFIKDRQAPHNPEDDAPGLLLRNRVQQRKFRHVDKSEMPSAYLTNIAKTKTISIPIHSSIGSLNLTHQIHKFKKKREHLFENDLKPYPQFPLKMTDSVETLISEFCKEKENLKTEDFTGAENLYPERVEGEEKYLRNAITSKIRQLKVVYNAYATMACDNPPPFKCLLLRLFLWQMLTDCQIPDSNRSLVEIDLLLANEDYLFIRNPHDPFEPIHFGQFVLILLTLSWDLYARHVFSKNPMVHEERVKTFLDAYEKSDCKYILKVAFDYLIEKDLLAGWSKSFSAPSEKTFLESDLAPLESMYSIYRSLGEPHSARDFLKKMISAEEEKNGNDDEKSIPGFLNRLCNLPPYLINGKNALTVAGELTYIPDPTPFNFPEIMDPGPGIYESESKTDLLFSTGLPAKKVVDCLMRSCPGMSEEGMILRMDHKLTFLEFYNAVILCTELALKLKKIKAIKRDLLEEHKRKMSEYERALNEQDRLKDNRAVSTKRSRQVMDISKTGKK